MDFLSSPIEYQKCFEFFKVMSFMLHKFDMDRVMGCDENYWQQYNDEDRNGTKLYLRCNQAQRCAWIMWYHSTYENPNYLLMVESADKFALFFDRVGSLTQDEITTIFNDRPKPSWSGDGSVYYHYWNKFLECRENGVGFCARLDPGNQYRLLGWYRMPTSE
jgi:hypothetical protein